MSTANKGPGASRLQRYLDELVDTSRQSWGLRLVIVCSVVGVVLAEGAASGGLWVWGLGGGVMLATAVAFRPDGPLALLLAGGLLWHWLVVVDSPTTPWLPIACACLLLFHSSTALAASLPVGGSLATETLVRWLSQTGLVAGFTTVVWSFVVLFEPSTASQAGNAGNGALTGLALMMISGVAIFIRQRSIH